MTLFPSMPALLEWVALNPVPGYPNKFGAATSPQRQIKNMDYTE